MRFKYTVKKSETKQPFMWEVYKNGDRMVLCQNETDANTLVELLTRIEAIDHKDRVRDDRRIIAMFQPIITASEIALGIVKDLDEKHYSVEDIEAIADWIHYQANLHG